MLITDTRKQIDQHIDVMWGEQVEPEHTGAAVADGVFMESVDALLNVYAAAMYAGVSRTTVLSWIRNGFIDSTTSDDGWLVRADDIERARQRADDARRGLTHHLEERELPAGEHRDLLLTQERVTQSNGSLSYGVLVPQAEFAREQSALVQEQAETIGWLQAELRRAREDLQPFLEPDVDQNQPDDVETADATVSGSDHIFADGYDPQRDREAIFDVIERDPLSEEAEQARRMIEDAESKVRDLWSDAEQLRVRHSQDSEPTPEEASWLNWLTSPLKRRES